MSSTSWPRVSGVAPSLSRSFVPDERARGDLAGHREHLAPLLEREIGRDQRTAPVASLDDHRRRRETGDHAVPCREPPRCGLHPRRVLGDDESARPDAASQLPMSGRVVAVDPTAEHRDRRAAGLERAAVRLSVDAARQPAHHDEPRTRPARVRASARPARRTASTSARRRRRPSRAGAHRIRRPRERTIPAADRGSRAAAAETPAPTRDPLDARLAQSSQYAASSKAGVTNTRNARSRGARTRWEPVSAAKAASASSLKAPPAR